MIFRESILKQLAHHTHFQVDFFKTFERKTVTSQLKDFYLKKIRSPQNRVTPYLLSQTFYTSAPLVAITR